MSRASDARPAGEAPAAGPGGAWRARRAALREGAMLWLMRAGMLAYALGFVLVAEAALSRLSRLF